jgi:branched-chain amino acid transport system permease protein
MMPVDPGYWAQQLLNALMLASFYVPLAMAFSLVQGITNRIFLSFGDLAMYAAFAAAYAGLWRLVSGDQTALVLGGSLVIAMACAAALGSYAADQVFAPLLRHSAQTFMIGSIGVSIVVQEIMRLQSRGRDVWMPPFDASAVTVSAAVGSSSVVINAMQLIVLGVSLTVVIGVMLVMQHSRFGRNWQASCQSVRLASLCGLDTGQVLRWSCIASALLASVSGWIIAVSYGGVTFSMGMMLGFKAMFASVIGGFGTMGGAILGGLLLALIETLWTAGFSLAYRDLAVFTFILMILLLKPEGLLGTIVRRESEEP